VDELMESPTSWISDPVDVASGGYQQSIMMSSAESLLPSTPSPWLPDSTLPRSATNEGFSPHATVPSPSISAMSQDTGHTSPVSIYHPASLYRPPPTPTAAELGRSDAQRQVQSLVLKLTRAPREVGLEAWTDASRLHRKTSPKFFCLVEGCRSKGFTAKHNYDCRS
ncbi:hypothetical protein PQX77_000729, partial [Marasmius sp. AFHP31]